MNNVFTETEKKHTKPVLEQRKNNHLFFIKKSL